MSELSIHHDRIRNRGVNLPVYWLARAIVQPSMQLYFLERGEPVLIFPEGKRVRSGPVGNPKRGAGRLALEASGAAPRRAHACWPPVAGG